MSLPNLEFDLDFKALFLVSEYYFKALFLVYSKDRIV